MKVYLAGPIDGCTDEQANGWRDAATTFLESRQHEALNPMTRDARGREEELYRQIVEGDKKDIDASDCVLVMATKPGWGTAMEVLYAYGRGKPVVCITGENPSPWIRYHSVYMVPSLEAGLAAILSL